MIVNNNRKSPLGLRYLTMRLCMLILITMCAFGTRRVMARGNLMENMIQDEENFQAQTHNKREINVLRLRSMDDNAKDDGDTNHVEGNHQKHDHMTHMAHMDPSLNVFLVENDLKVGRVMPIYFPNIDPSSYPHFLPREQADAIPFSSEKLPYLLQFFSFSEGSPKAKTVRDTLRLCELDPVEGESKTCATSLESMLDFVRTMFGMGTLFRAVSTIHHERGTTSSQSHPVLSNYTILNISEVSANQVVACHTMPYPYAVFFCHHLVSKSKVFKVNVISESDEEVEALVVCHMDTSAWSPDHFSFRVLMIKPGTDPVCHFFPADLLVWVPSTPSS